MTLDEINAELESLEVQKAGIQARKKELAKLRVAYGKAEHAAYYGLTPDEYDGVKLRARAEASTPDGTVNDEAYRTAFNRLLGKARRQRAVQVARTSVAEIGASASSAR